MAYATEQKSAPQTLMIYSSQSFAGLENIFGSDSVLHRGDLLPDWSQDSMSDMLGVVFLDLIEPQEGLFRMELVLE